MSRKGHSPEQVVNKLQQVEVAVAGGTVATLHRCAEMTRYADERGSFR